MPDLISSLSAVMRAEIETLDTVAQNNANVNTHGYRAQRSTIAGESFNEMIIGGQPELNIAHTSDQANGSLAITNRVFDLAITGDAWFVVEYQNEILLTRNGKFHIDKDNTLVTIEGHKVLGEGNVPIDVDNATMNVSADGEVRFDSGSMNQLQLVKSTDVKAVGNGFYRAESSVEPAVDYKVIQGALEKSNVDTSEEMVRLMQTTRHIESLQRAMSTYDSLLRTGVGEIGK